MQIFSFKVTHNPARRSRPPCIGIHIRPCAHLADRSSGERSSGRIIIGTRRLFAAFHSLFVHIRTELRFGLRLDTVVMRQDRSAHSLVSFVHHDRRWHIMNTFGEKRAHFTNQKRLQSTVKFLKGNSAAAKRLHKRGILCAFVKTEQRTSG